MIKTKMAALTLAGLMAATSGIAFADSNSSSATPDAGVNKNATKLPGNNTAPSDRNASSTPGAQTGTQESGVTPQTETSHGSAAHGDTHDKTSTDTGSGKTSN
jgi:hypothetical protein